MVPSGQGRRRARRSTASSVMQMPRAPVGAGWTVVTASPTLQNPGHNSMPTLRPVNSRQNDYMMGSPYSAHMRGGPASSDSHLLSPATSAAELNHNHMSIPSHDGSSSRYANHHPPTSYRSPKDGLSLDIRSLSMRERSSDSEPPPKLSENFKLPPIQAPSGGESSSDSPYALPPISAMEDVRGSSAQDSAAVLRRLRMDDDDYYPRAGRSDNNNNNDQTWARRHSLSAHPSS